MNSLSKKYLTKKVHPKEAAVEGRIYSKIILLYLMDQIFKLNFQEEPLKRLKQFDVSHPSFNNLES